MMNRKTATKRCTFVTLIGLALFAIGCGGDSSSGGSPATPSGPDNLVTLFITNGVYSPNPLTVKVGQRVNWKNNDTRPHTATMAGVFDTGSIAPTSAADDPVAMNTVGTATFHCTLHAGETGTIVTQP